MGFAYTCMKLSGKLRVEQMMRSAAPDRRYRECDHDAQRRVTATTCYRVPTMSEQPQPTNDVQASVEEVWYLKDISFKPDPAGPSKKFKIITQNFNG